MIPDGEVHIWRALLDGSRADPVAASRLLSPDELARANRGSDIVCRRRILSRAALREILGHYLGIAPDAMSFMYGPFGKPRLKDVRREPHPLRFNVSRSGDYCLIAVARREVGIDVEGLEARDDIDEVSGRFFARQEAAAIRRLDGEPKLRAFYRCWTCKEAVVKALGSGLAGGALDRFTISTDDPWPSVTLDTKIWRLATPPVDDDFSAAVALDGEGITGPLAIESGPSVGLLAEAQSAIQRLMKLV